jgi:hypothetical protein
MQLSHLQALLQPNAKVLLSTSYFKNRNLSLERQFSCREYKFTLCVWVNLSVPTVSGYELILRFIVSVLCPLTDRVRIV